MVNCYFWILAAIAGYSALRRLSQMRSIAGFRPPGAALRSYVMSIVRVRQPRWFKFLMPASSSLLKIGWRKRKR